MSPTLNLFAAAPKGMERLLADELASLGAESMSVARAGVAFRGSLETAYRVCLWSRLANRVLLNLGRFPAATPEALYQGIRGVDWGAHLAPNGTLAVNFQSSASAITHTHYGALKVKDAVVDQFRDAFGARPSVDLERPDLRINVFVLKDRATVSIDLSGQSLHRRGYRAQGVAAPLKENLAAAILTLAGWPEVARRGGPLLDPMCGSGTLPIEAALMAGDIAPGLLRDYFGFLAWKGHDAQAWQALLAQARDRRGRGLPGLPEIRGRDRDPRAVRVARGNAAQAGLDGRVTFAEGDLADARPGHGGAGLLLANPPYGERIGERRRLERLYAELGNVLKVRFHGWRAAVFSADESLARAIGLKPRGVHVLYNGALECRLHVYPNLAADMAGAGTGARPAAPPRPRGGRADGAPMLVNRLGKNLRHLGRWARRNDVACYRVYDADLPEYALAVDLYRGDETWAHVQEYAAPASIDPERAEERLGHALAVIPQALEVAPTRVYCKRRQRQKGEEQYRKQGEGGAFHAVDEGGLRFLVNFTDYLDTGLFLDHRDTRALLRELAAGRRFLNLFAYTGAATVYAAAGGAASTTSVDMSRTYLDWARRNLELNALDRAGNAFIQADCLEWLARGEAPAGGGAGYDLIFLDPPTFSNSKRMRQSFDVQRDHVDLIRRAAGLLAPRGVLIFSTNHRRFKLDSGALAELGPRDITRATIPPDFSRNPRIHRCWRFGEPSE